MLPRLAAQPVQRQHGLIAQGLVEGRRHLGHEAEEALLVELEPVVPAADGPGHAFGLRALVEVRVGEAHREGGDPGVMPGRHRGQDRAVDPPGQEDPHRNVGHQPRDHRPLDEVGELVVARRTPRRAQERLVVPRKEGSRIVDRDGGTLAGQHAADAPQDRGVPRDVVDAQIPVESLHVDRGVHPGKRRQAQEVGAVGEAGTRAGVIERLLAEAVACQVEDTPLPVEDRDSVHAVQPLQQTFHAPAREAVGEGLRVARGLEPASLGLQLPAKVGVVVDLAVLEGDHLPVLALQRLPSVLEIDHGEPAHRHGDASLAEVAAPVRAALVHEVPQAGEGRRGHALHLGVDPAEDPAHDANPPFAPAWAAGLTTPCSVSRGSRRPPERPPRTIPTWRRSRSSSPGPGGRWPRAGAAPPRSRSSPPGHARGP